jgi:hypothetical protein
MDRWTSGLVCAVLLLFAAGLMAAHVRSWRAAGREQLAPQEFDYRRRQFRRRMRTSAMLGVVALLLPLGEALVPWIHSRALALCYWGGVLAVLVWICLMAVLDMLATHFHFSRLRQEYRVEQARLRAELRRIRQSAVNGRIQPPKPGSNGNPGAGQ